MLRVQERQNKPVHTVVRYNHTMEGCRDYMLGFVMKEKTVAFEKIFEPAEDRIHAIFLFLSILELTQQKFMKMMIGEGRNNFIVEWNEHREADLEDAGLTDELFAANRKEEEEWKDKSEKWKMDGHFTLNDSIKKTKP